MDECIFCKVIKKESRGYFVMEETNYVAFLDIFGVTLGHTLVVPRKHGFTILDYSDEELGQIMGGVKKAAAKLKKTLNSDSITIGINHEEKKGVPHLHIHLIPRFENDGGKIIQSLVKSPISESMEKIAERIREA